MLAEVGAQEAEDKSVPPSAVCDFLGVLFNVIKGTMEVTPQKLQDIYYEVTKMQKKTYIYHKDLEHVIGKLQFVAACVRPGRVFINRSLNTLRSLALGQRHAMDLQTKKDLMWWEIFLPLYNGVSIMWMQQNPVPDSVIACDACLKGAGGILWGKGFYRLTFPPEWQDKNIAYLEMLAIILAVKVWGHELRGNRIVINCDNESCCYVINFGRSKDLFLQAAMRELVYLLATFQVELKVTHVLSDQNQVPDWLSRWPLGGEVRKKFRNFARGKRLQRYRPSAALLKFSHDW